MSQLQDVEFRLISLPTRDARQKVWFPQAWAAYLSSLVARTKVHTSCETLGFTYLIGPRKLRGGNNATFFDDKMLNATASLHQLTRDNKFARSGLTQPH